MKKLIASASLLGIGVAGIQAAYAPGLSSVETSKPWSIGASLRGFYDDNYTTSPSALSRSTWGTEIEPSFGLNLPLDQTYIGLNYTYGAKYYEDSSKWDQSHQARLTLSHAFTQHVKLDVNETFISAQEPAILEDRGPITFPLRSEGNNLRNTASAALTTELTEEFSTVVSYSNTIWDYEQDAKDVADPVFNPTGSGSRSALLDRMEHMLMLNLRYQIAPSTVTLVGYQYGVVDYTSKSDLVPGLSASVRDSRSHYAYAGVDHYFTQQLNGSLRVGAQFTDYPNAPVDDSVLPYADASLSYTYTTGSYVQVGVRHALNQTDVGLVFLGGGAIDPTLNQESTTLYGSINHKFTGSITGSLLGQYQNSQFNGGGPGVDGRADDLFLVGVTLRYQINQFLSTDVGYSFDRLDSDLLGRSFSRNRVFAGIRATF